MFAGFLILGNGCNNNDRQFVKMGTAPVGGVFKQVGDAIANVLNENKGDAKWSVQASGTKGTQQNIRMLDKGEAQLGMSNSAIAYFAARGEGIWEKKYEVQAVATLAPNIGLFITKADSGIKTIADLKGKRVAVGPAGAGFEMFLGPILTAHGVKYGVDIAAEDYDITPIPANYSDAATMLGDGSIDAAFMGGATPVPSVTQATVTMDLFYIPFDDEVRKKLIADYSFFQDATIPAKNAKGESTYKGLESDFAALNVGSMQLVTQASVDEGLIYDLAKLLWENREKIAAQHKAGNAINEKNVARYTGIEFHPGAIKFYKEIGIWKDPEN